MAPTQWLTNNKGKSILVPGGGAGNNGQCEQAVDSFIHDVLGIPYVYTPNASDFWTKFDQLGLGQYFDKVPRGQPILPNDIIIYDSRVGAPQGHIDAASRPGIITDFWAYDSNWGNVRDPKTGYPILYEAHHADLYNNYVYGYLRIKEGGEAMLDASHQATLFVAYLGRLPQQAEVDRDVGKISTDTMINNLDQSSEYAAKKSRDEAAYAALNDQTTGVTRQGALDYISKNLQ